MRSVATSFRKWSRPNPGNLPIAPRPKSDDGLKSGRTNRRRRGSSAGPLLLLKWFHERLIEIVDVREVLPSVILGLRKDVILDQIEHDIAEIAAPGDAPSIQDGLCQGAKLVQSVGP